MTTLELQTALKALGFDPGRLDGIPGRLTSAALRAFQKSRGLPDTGVVGARTLAALVGTGAQIAKPALPIPWYDEAVNLIGTKETVGPGNTPVIMDWAEEIEVASAFTADAIPWCGLFVGHCIAFTLPHEVLPATPLWAKSWAKFGVHLAGPAKGAICVLTRPGGGGHVFFADAVTKDRKFVRGVGGNTSDMVKSAWFDAARVIAYRWPATVALPTAKMPVVDRTTGVSVNES